MVVQKIAKAPRWSAADLVERRPRHRRKPLMKRLPTCMVSAIDEVGEFREALHRYREGTVGSCSACGRRISTSGLMFLPHETLCLSCRNAEKAL